MMTRSVVVQRTPRTRRLFWFAAAALLLAVFAVGYLTAGGGGLFALYRSALVENRELREQVAEQAGELQSLRQWQADNTTRFEINSQALDLVRGELGAQQETIAELERGIHFYKSLMTPEEAEEGLGIRSVEVSPRDGNGHYAFRVLVQQSARKHELITGTLNVRLFGSQGGAPVEYDLADLSEQIPSADIRLRFKYFQAVDGELTLPGGFEPRSVQVTAKPAGSRQAAVTAEFPWSTQGTVQELKNNAEG